MPVSAGIVGGAAIGGVGSVLGGKTQAKAANRATDAQLQAAREAIAAQREGADKAADVFREQNRESRDFLRESFARARQEIEQDPFRQAGRRAVKDLESFTRGEGGFQDAQRKQIQSQLQRQLASQGLLRSGRQATELGNVELGLAQQRLDALQGLAGFASNTGQQLSNLDLSLGQALASGSQQLGSQLGSLFGNLGSNIGNTLQGAGQAQAQGLLAAGQARAQTLGQLSNIANQTGSNLLAVQQQRENNALAQSNFERQLQQQRELFGLGGGGLGTTPVLGGRNVR